MFSATIQSKKERYFLLREKESEFNLKLAVSKCCCCCCSDAQSCLTLCNPWTAALQVSLSITISQSLRNLMSIESVMPTNHLILCHPLLFLPSIFPRIRIFFSESELHIRLPKYWSFSFSISPFSDIQSLFPLRK